MFESIDPETLTRLTLDIGEIMYLSGAEIARIEDTLGRLGRAYGARHVNVYAITSSLVVTIDLPEHPMITHSRRIRRSDTDLTKLEAVNALCRECAGSPLPLDKLEARVRQIRHSAVDPRRILLGEVISAAAFAVFFGGSAADALVSSLFALVIFLLERHYLPLCHSRVFFNLTVSLLVGSAVCLLGHALPMLHVSLILIGDIMILIPGIAVTNSIRYIISGDSISSMEKLVDALLQGVAIAAGFAAALGIFG